MPGRKPLKERLTKTNSVLWCELDVGSIRARAYLVDRNSRQIPEMRDALGWTEAETGILLVGWDLPEEMAEQTLLHEIVHQTIFAHGVRIHPEGAEVTDQQEEAVVNPLASALYDALKRNELFFVPPRPEIPKRRRKL